MFHVLGRMRLQKRVGPLIRPLPLLDSAMNRFSDVQNDVHFARKSLIEKNYFLNNSLCKKNRVFCTFVGSRVWCIFGRSF